MSMISGREKAMVLAIMSGGFMSVQYAFKREYRCKANTVSLARVLLPSAVLYKRIPDLKSQVYPKFQMVC